MTLILHFSGRLTTAIAHLVRPVRFSAKVFASLILLLLLLAAIGCGPRQPVTVTVVDPEWSQPDEAPRAERAAEAFTRKTGILLKPLPVPETSLSQLDLLKDLLQRPTSSPDVVGVDVIWPGMLAGSFMDLKSPLSSELSTLDPELVAAYTVDGKVVAIPYHAHIGVLQYRKDLLAAYGYDHPPRTWDELEQMAARIQAGERAKGKRDFWGYVWQGAAAEGLTCNALEWQVAEGGGPIIEGGKTISVNNPATIRAWERAARWIGRISPPGVVAYRELDSMNLWDGGSAAFRRTWQWRERLARWQDLPMPEKTGFASMPGGPGGRVGTLGGIGLAVAQSSPHKEEALALIRFLLAEEAHLNAGSAAGPGRGPELYELPAILDPLGKEKRGSEKRPGVVSRPSNLTGQAYEQVTKAYIEAIHSVLVGEKSAPAAAAELEKRLVSITGYRVTLPGGAD